MAKKRQAYSLTELIVVVAFIGIFAAIAVPRLNFALISKNKAETTARKIVTDLRRTRRMAISDAANNDDGYELNMTGGSPYTGYEIENSDTDEIVDSHTFDSAITCTGDSKFRFEPLGNLKDAGHKNFTVSAEGKTFTITVIRATGMIKCTEN